MIRSIFTLILSFTVLLSWAQQPDRDFFDAVRDGSNKTVKNYLSENPGWINMPNEAGYSALILAAYYNQTSTIKLLLEQGADIHFLMNEANALHGACFKGYTKAAAALIEAGCKVNVRDANGTTPLLYAVMGEHKKLVTLLLESGADPSIQDNNGISALDYANVLDLTDLVATMNQLQEND